jgi:hypothetical protein
MVVIPRFPHVLYDAEHNPEQWPEAGAILVFLGHFSWLYQAMEPLQEGTLQPKHFGFAIQERER